MYHPDGRAFGFPDPDSVLNGPEEFVTNWRMFREVFPDVHITVDDLVAEDDRVAVLWTATMTHLGDGLGFPASLKKVSFQGSSFLVYRDGQFTEGRNQMDFTKVRLQLQEKI
jgi:predicted ester cyclase